MTIQVTTAPVLFRGGSFFCFTRKGVSRAFVVGWHLGGYRRPCICRVWPFSGVCGGAVV
nr:MAG TPA: hypothetical protein [Caudoviricetes sp.]